ncbi:MAG: energy transducer TonB [Muribaculaceae bacterium]|nr:energy transducer TonB [Muribaculaceae bacterium]MDE6321274.1 energy transducer TonB [Muribaculaceae bacterium]
MTQDENTRLDSLRQYPTGQRGVNTSDCQSPKCQLLSRVSRTLIVLTMILMFGVVDSDIAASVGSVGKVEESRQQEDTVFINRYEDEIFRANIDPISYINGGEPAFYQAILENFNFPESAAELNIQGLIKVEFEVLNDGSVGEVKVIQSLDPDLDNELVRVIRKVGKFRPYTYDLKPEERRLTLPFRVKIKED